ncbi:LysR substrate-binding domain-containing protein [Methylovirgula sp. 4M-Z18]|uniref:LysR substrate-binding domain-containing protein n=1 Tax=Methylovirgula sp. 4M-Z18 TaxID=2293567 RepID=UPI000E2FCEBD|nr:LysR substrate-binding domain-containing protein [Methylovirgula sp. 4M-Z18]RFB81373.1 LysR family transcriptional regulator [Methylovirgula sp. 4M-Z18]
MDRDLLSHLPIVLQVARHQGFASAAAALDMSPSAVSHAVRTVEDRLGEPLFARTTRSVALTEAGQRFLARIGPALDEIGAAFEALAAERGDVTGVLRLNAPRVAVHMALTPILAALAAKHPRLTVELHTNDAFVDIVAEGFDAGVRLGVAVQQDMVALRLAPPFQAILVASPAYLTAHGAPQTLRDLERHNCIGFRFVGSGGVYDWELEENGRTIAVKTSGTLRVTDGTYVRDLALAGVGIGYIFEPLVRQELKHGQLVQLLPHSAIEEDGLFLYYPRRASLAPKLRAFVEAAKAVAHAK